MQGDDKIIPINIESEMKSAYIDYSMSVIVSRALPDVRDGFKPVHRRVLFGMNELGNTSSGETKKSARIVGEVMGNTHPARIVPPLSPRIRTGKLRFDRWRLTCGHALHRG